MRATDYTHVSIGIFSGVNGSEDYNNLVEIAKNFVEEGFEVYMRKKSVYNAIAVRDLPEYQAHTLSEIGFDVVSITSNMRSILYTEEIKN